MKKGGVDVGNLSMSSPFFSLNAFEKFNLPFALDINLEDLEQQYFKAQQQYHPDRLKMHKDSQEDITTHYAEAFNEAYQTLKDPLKRAEHLLKCLGWLTSEEHLPANQDPKLLTFMMELNDKIEDAITPEKKQNLAGFLQREMKKSWDSLERFISSQDKNEALTFFFNLKYLNRLQTNLK
jgi:molecular chaperone HscB